MRINFLTIEAIYKAWRGRLMGDTKEVTRILQDEGWYNDEKSGRWCEFMNDAGEVVHGKALDEAFLPDFIRVTDFVRKSRRVNK